MNLSKRPIWTVTALYWLAIFTATHLPARDLPPIPVSDKVEHMTAYGLLGILLFAAVRSSGLRIARAALLVIAIGLLYGAVDELLQIPIGRTCDIHDWYADAAGIGLATIICVVVEFLGHRNQNDETRKPNE